MAEISDELAHRIVTVDYERSKSSRDPRRRKNEANWKAIHSEFDWLTRKAPWQSREILPSLAMSLEQACGTLASQLVSFDNWFSAEAGEVTGLPPLLMEALGDASFIDADSARKLLRWAVDRLAAEGNEIPTTHGPQELIYKALKLGFVESEIVSKVGLDTTTRPVYRYLPPEAGNGNGAGLDHLRPAPLVALEAVKECRLKIELIPFEDFFPDPSPHNLFQIHEVTIHRSQLGQFGWDEAKVKALQAWMDEEADAAKRARSGQADLKSKDPHSIRVREYWGTMIDPDSGDVVAENVLCVVGGPYVLESPKPNPWWHGRSPFVRVVLIPTPLAPTHQAFLDYAAPIFECETELANLAIDGGAASAHGIKEVDKWRIENQNDLDGGLRPGLEVETQENKGPVGVPVIRRVDTGTLTEELLTVWDRVSKIRQEAMAVPSLQLAQFAQGDPTATEVVAVKEGSNDLFSQMAVRLEDGWLEPTLELSWLTLWQGLDRFSSGDLRAALGKQRAALLATMPAEMRFVAAANSVRFKVEGYKYQLQRVRDFQKYVTYQNGIMANPALLFVFQQKYSPLKLNEELIRSLGIDPTRIERDPTEPLIPTQLLMGQAGNPQNPAMAPDRAAMTEETAPPNPTGEQEGFQA